MNFLAVILTNKRWSLIAVLSAIVLAQLAYSNHLSGKLSKAQAQCDTRLQSLNNAHFEAMRKQQEQANVQSAKYESERADQAEKVQTVTRNVTKIVERSVYRDACLDSDGLQQINSLISSE